MDNIINFPSKVDPAVTKLVDLGREIDLIMIKYLSEGAAVKDVAAVVGHRMSELLLTLPREERLNIWIVIYGIVSDRVKKH